MPQPTPREIGERHQALLGPRARRAAGAFYTPDELIACVLDLTLEPLLEDLQAASTDAQDLVRRLLDLTVCDPACGTGLFLLAAAQRIAARGPGLDQVLAHCIFGVDLDREAVEQAKALLPGARLEVGNALIGAPLHLAERAEADAWCAAYTPLTPFHWQVAFPTVFARGGFGVVIGNPPFLNRLESATALDRDQAALLRDLLGEVAPYTDVSALFLRRCLDLVRSGGRLGLVQPLSLLAARDAAPVRAYVARAAALTGIWVSARPVFEGASVLTCAVSLVEGAEQGPVEVRVGDTAPATVGAGDLAAEWGHLVAAAFGIPAVALSRESGVLGDLADCAADFRDQYYGLEPFVHESRGDPAEMPLITSGLIEPGRTDWGARTTRFLKRTWQAPVIDRSVLDDPRLGVWAHKRLVPKILVATQGRVIEAVADPQGRWLPSVPVLSVTPAAGQMWRVFAVLMAPPVVAQVAATYFGTALSTHAIKLSARQLASLPLPVHEGPWTRAAALLEASEPAPEELTEVARLMCAAYGADPRLLDWWLDRARLRGRGSKGAGPEQ